VQRTARLCGGATTLCNSPRPAFLLLLRRCRLALPPGWPLSHGPATQTVPSPLACLPAASAAQPEPPPPTR
jgi:hypothetical protein